MQIRRVAVTAALVGCACVLGGWMPIYSNEWQQQETVGDVRLTITLCASGRNDGPGGLEDHPGCPQVGNSGLYASDGTTLQALFAVRLPLDVPDPPDALTSSPAPSPPAPAQLTFRRSASFEAELDQKAAAPAGFRWVGYLSDPYLFIDGANGVSAQSVPLSFDLKLPVSSDGSPFIGPLRVLPVSGVRLALVGAGSQRPVECGASPFVVAASTICIDSPSQLQIDSPLQIQVRDFGIVGGSATASPGQTVRIPFGVRGAGALPAGLTAGLTAATAVPGATATPSQTSAPLTNGSDTRVTVDVAIPRGAGPGVHDVTLTGRLENGQTRVGTARLTVRDRQAPRITGARARPAKVRPAPKRKPRRGGTTVSFTLSETASVVGTVERCTRFAKAKRAKPKRCVRYRTLKGRLAHRGAAGTNRFRFNGRLRGRALAPGAYRLALVATDAAGNRSAPARVPFTVPLR